MPTNQACYRKLTNYKYQLMETYSIPVGIKPPQAIDTLFVSLDVDGTLTMRKSYAWDGPSGPTIDTKDFMRGSLVHDALYQLMRLGKLAYKTDRQKADELLRDICLEDGMSKVRAWYVYKSVRLFAEPAARPRPEQKDEIICVP